MAQGAATPPTPPPAIVSANNTFGFHLYAALTKANATALHANSLQPTAALMEAKENQNVFISPLSIEFCLAMVANGAKGNTYTQIAQTLGWRNMPLEEVNAGFQTLTKRLLSSDPKVQLSLADSLWLNNKAAFHQTFTDTNSKYFGAEMRAVNFTDPATVPTINNWVNAKTQGMIPTLLKAGDVDNTTLLVLLNALYFKGQWSVPFDPQLTTEQPFMLAAGTNAPVKMMQRSGKISYYDDANLQMVRLPYGDGRLSMTIILPTDGQTLDAVAQLIFTEHGWQQYTKGLRGRQGTLSLPRFAAHYAADLPAALRTLGISDAFTNKADFSAISDTPSWISNVKHKTALEVNEEGTKAAAVTDTTMVGHAAMPSPFEPPFLMNVNHPFLLALQNEDGALLFLGHIVKPE